MGTYLMILTLVAATALLLIVLWRYILGAGGPRRTSMLLMGLPNSGKTCLFAKLSSGDEVQTCTSMEINEAHVRVKEAEVCVLDHPGHRRLYPSLRQCLLRALRVVVVVDSVSIHDDRHEGAAAVAELLHSFLQTPEFYGVKKILIACTKRDEVTSYSSKAVKKLLEAAMVTCIQSRRGELSHVDEVLDSNGAVVGKRQAVGGSSGSGRHYVLELGDHDEFRFEEHMPIPVEFADVSSFPETMPSGFSTEPVRQFFASPPK